MSATNKSKITKLLQQSILELCKVTLPNDEACDIDGILCVTLGKDSPIDYVVKIHETLEPHITIKSYSEDLEDCKDGIKEKGALEEKDRFEEKSELTLGFQENTVHGEIGRDFKKNTVHEEIETENENYEDGMLEDEDENDEDDDEVGYISGVDYLDADSMDVVDESRQVLDENNADVDENETSNCTPVTEESNSQEDEEAANETSTEENVEFSSVIGQIIFKHEEEKSLDNDNNSQAEIEIEKCEGVKRMDESVSNIEKEAKTGVADCEQSGTENGETEENLKYTENNQVTSDKVDDESECELNDSKDNILMNESYDNMQTALESETGNKHTGTLENEMDNEEMGCLVEITEANQESMDCEQSDVDSNENEDKEMQLNEATEKDVEMQQKEATEKLLENDPDGTEKEEAIVEIENSIKDATFVQMTQPQSIQEENDSVPELQNANVERTESTSAEVKMHKSQSGTEMKEQGKVPNKETITGETEPDSDDRKDSQFQSNVESTVDMPIDSQQNFNNVNVSPIQTIVVMPETRPPRPESVMIVGQTPPKRAKSNQGCQAHMAATSVISSPVASIQQNRPVVASSSVSNILLCSICEVEMPNTGALKEHYESFHLLHVCDVCSATFKHKINYDLHVITHSNEKARQSRDPIMTVDANRHLKCGICGSVFNQSATLYEHIRTSHDFQTFLSCILCGEFFPNYHTFGYHRKSVHSSIKEIVCKFCKNGFAQKEIARHRLECNKSIPQQGAYMDLMSLAEKVNKVNQAKNNDVEILGVEINNSIRTPTASPSRQSITPFKSPQATPPKTWMNSQRSPVQRSPVQQYSMPMSPVRQRVPPSPGRRRGAYNQGYSPIPKTVGDLMQTQQQQQNRVQHMQTARYTSPVSANVQQSPQRGRRGYDAMQQMSPTMRANIMNRFPTSPQSMNQGLPNQYPAPGRAVSQPRFHTSQASAHPYQRSPQRQRPRNIPGQKGSKETPINLDPEEEITIVEPAKKRQDITQSNNTNSTTKSQGSSSNLSPHLQMALNTVLSKLLKPTDQPGTTQDNNTAASPLKISSVYSVNPQQTENAGQHDSNIQDAAHSNPSDLPQPIVETETDGQVIDIRPQADGDMNQPKPPFICQLCNHSFTDFRAFVKHNSNIHFRSVCSFCGDTFSDASSMAQHMAEHMGGSGSST